MMSRKANDGVAPRPEELAAYADGELQGAARARVQAWLVGHPEAADEVAAVRSLDRLCRAAGPSVPDEAAWANVLQRVEQQTELNRRRPTAAWRRMARVLIPLSGAAAILLVFSHVDAYNHHRSLDQLQ
jgi:anti-sigma factor RsiW